MKLAPGEVSFINLPKVFDTADHRKLLDKLDKPCFRGAIQSLQSGCEYGSVFSSTTRKHEIKTGLSQGSVHRPFLFVCSRIAQRLG